MTEQEIRDLFETHSVPLSRTDVWQVQQANVLKHSALERLAAALKLTWDMPTIVRSERDECVVLVRATRLDGVSEWSFGEALIQKEGQPGNYKVSGKQAAYVYAMGEKRAKDRVIIKLAGLHGAYSEEEADDFKSREQEASRPTPVTPVTARSDLSKQPAPFCSPDDRADAQNYVARAKLDILNAETPAELDAWWKSESPRRRELGIVNGTTEFSALVDAFRDRKTELDPARAAA